MALWTAGILLALGLVWFVGTVAVSLLEVRGILGNVQLPYMRYALDTTTPTPEEAVARLGGEAAAARKLALYYRMPDRLVPRREEALYLLSCCGEPAVPALARVLLSDAHENERAFAAQSLGKIGQGARPAVPALIETVKSERSFRSEYGISGWHRLFGQWEAPGLAAIKALGEIGPDASAAVPVLEAMVGERLRTGVEARAALRKITGRDIPEPQMIMPALGPFEVNPPPSPSGD